MSKQHMIDKLPRFTRNFFFISGLFFLVWMMFFYSNDIYSQYMLSKKLSTLEEQKEYYQEKIIEVKEDREELLSDEVMLEKFAREKYLMKRPTEDIYILVEED